jgi:S1-C subfamily serine protease
MRATFLHLSGSKQGRVETLDLDRIRIGTDPTNDLAFDPARDAPVASFHAVIRFANGEFCLSDLWTSGGTFVNAQQIGEVVLQDGDILEFGAGGPRLRFRARPEDRAAAVPFRHILDDSRALARATYRGPLVSAPAFLRHLLRQTAREASWAAKATLLAILLLVVASVAAVPVLLVRSTRERARYEQTLQIVLGQLRTEHRSREELERIVNAERDRLEALRAETSGGLAELATERDRLKRRLDEAVAAAAARAEEARRLRAQLGRAEARLRTLEEERAAGERIIGRYAGGVAFLLGSVTFADAAGRPLRYAAVDEDGLPLRDPFGNPRLTREGDGPVVAVSLGGTAFLVSRDGALLTNRHVVEPWARDENVAPLVAAGFRPTVQQLRAFFPDRPAPYAAQVARLSDRGDLALLRVGLAGAAVPVLDLDRTGQAAVAGRPVILMGYPAGLEALLARLDPATAAEVLRGRRVDFQAVAEELARRRLIRPSTTRGYLSDVQPHQVTYDALTAAGGSGGPLFDQRGLVIAVNFAVLREFPGANYGVPIRLALDLLPSPAPSSRPPR